ncbi:MAG TPA: hypothetical protein DCM38_12410 [Gammaproteobacteria bacterium]|nr:hypothetical protein [Gammaproteobacteria bacterium]
MTRIVEGYLVFEFGEKWRVFKLDEHRDYREHIGKIDETKAVDFVGIFDNKILYFIEIKDFRGHRIENKERLLKGNLPTCQLVNGECQFDKGRLSLPIELAQKVRDSIACIIGSCRTSSEPEEWLPYAKWLCHQDREIKVILWLEHDLPDYPLLRKKVMASISTKIFKQKLRWLTAKVLVCSSDNQGLPDVKVRNLHRS